MPLPSEDFKNMSSHHLENTPRARPHILPTHTHTLWNFICNLMEQFVKNKYELLTR